MFFWVELRTAWSQRVFSPYRKPQEGSLTDCGKQGSVQGAEANETRDDGSLKRPEGLIQHHTKHFISSPFSEQWGSDLQHVSCTSRIGLAERKPFGKIPVKAFPWRILMILGHKTKSSEVLALPHFKRSRSEKQRTNNVGLEVICWSPFPSLCHQSTSGTSQKSFLIASLLQLEVPLTSFYNWKTRE